MSKKTAIANAIVSFVDQPITSLTDLGYRQGVTKDVSKKQAEYALEKIVGFPDTLPDTDKEALYKGYMMRFNENHPPIEYAIIDGNYLRVDTLSPDAKALERVVIGVDVVFSYTQQEYGKLKSTDRAKYDVFKPWREGFVNYASGCVSDLKREARRIIKSREAGGNERQANLDFAEFIERLDKDGKTKIGWLDSGRTRCLTAKKRGDATADIERFDKAMIAFRAVWFG